MSIRTRRVALTAKLIFGLGLLVVLVLAVDVDGLAEQLRRLRPAWVFAVLILPHLAIWLSAVKWKLLLGALDIHVGHLDAFVLYLIGTFFNNFLPSTAGGDLVRTVQLGLETRSAEGVVAATLAERAIGFLALLTWLPLFFFEPQLRTDYRAAWLLFPGVTVAFLLVMWLLLRGNLPEIARRLPIRRISSAVARSRDQVAELGHHQATLFTAYLLSLAFYGVAIGTVYAATRAFDLSIAVGGLAAGVPAILLFGMLPVTFNGLGLNEVGYVAVLGSLGVPAVSGLSIALLLRTRALLTAAVGGLLFLFRRHRRRGTDGVAVRSPD